MTKGRWYDKREGFMRLSSLQKFILLECLNSKTGRISRTRLPKFYNTVKKDKRPTDLMITKIITKSIERLIDKELMVGFGERTPHKWYIKDIKLMQAGKRVAKKLLGEQMPLPFKTRKHRKQKNTKTL